MEKGLEVQVLGRDAELRGIETSSDRNPILRGSFDSLIDLMESCDRVLGLF